MGIGMITQMKLNPRMFHLPLKDHPDRKKMTKISRRQKAAQYGQTHQMSKGGAEKYELKHKEMMITFGRPSCDVRTRYWSVSSRCSSNSLRLDWNLPCWAVSMLTYHILKSSSSMSKGSGRGNL
ncbi:MAG: hypothetical protein KatS3mg028_1700 [Bacteroidia bacterium]|nr:MAG: hypothetical protein KatS3mg028_1700 [Bacteroidia bacterium]